jgi:hypothetical protein
MMEYGDGEGKRTAQEPRQQFSQQIKGRNEPRGGLETSPEEKPSLTGILPRAHDGKPINLNNTSCEVRSNDFEHLGSGPSQDYN